MKKKLLWLCLVLAMLVVLCAQAMAEDEALMIEAVGENVVAVERNGTATLEVAVTSGDPESVTYQWYSEEYDSEEDVWHVNPIEGATGPAYTTGPITKRVDYHCEATDGSGEKAYAYFTVTVQNHLRIDVVGEEFVSVGPNDTATLEATASADDMEGLTYQWYTFEYDDELDALVQVSIEGATAPVYTTDPITGYVQYTCEVTDKYGMTDGVSFYVTVENHLQVDAVGETELAVALNSTVTLEATATADDMEGLTYQWYTFEYDDELDGLVQVSIEGATGPVYTTGPITGYVEYSCEATDRYGMSAGIGFIVTVENHLQVDAVGINYRTVAPNDTVVMEVTVTADDKEGLTYQWYTEEFNSEENWWYESPIEGATGASYTIEAAGRSVRYYCRVTDRYGTTDVVGFTVTIENHLQVEAVGETKRPVELNGNVSLEVTVTADDTEGLAYQWYVERYTGEYWIREKVSGATGASCQAENVTEAREYYCEVTDKYGTQRSVMFSVYVQNHLTASAVGPDSIGVAYGGSAELAVAASADEGELSYQWFKYDEDNYNYVPVSGADGPALTAENITYYTEYQCVITDIYEKTVDIYFEVYPENHFTVTADPAVKFVVIKGDDVTLTAKVTADNMENVSYWWYGLAFDSTGTEFAIYEIPDGDGPSITLEEVEESCTVACGVSDCYGTYRTVTIKVIVVENGNSFDDVKKENYFFDPVLWAVNNSITVGTGKGAFSPASDCTRGQIVTFLWRAAGSPEPKSNDNPFKDVAEDAYYYKAVLWAVENGITQGTGADTFSPGNPCTRAQVVTFLYRFEGEPKVEGVANPFTDVAEDAYYYKAVLWAVAKGVTAGTSADTFSPANTCTRGQIVTFLFRDIA